MKAKVIVKILAQIGLSVAPIMGEIIRDCLDRKGGKIIKKKQFKKALKKIKKSKLFDWKRK